MTASSSLYLLAYLRRISCSFCHCISIAERWQPLPHYIHGKINILYFVHYCCHISMDLNMAGTWQPLHHFFVAIFVAIFIYFSFFFCKGCLQYVFSFLLLIIIYISRVDHGCNITALNHHISSYLSIKLFCITPRMSNLVSMHRSSSSSEPWTLHGTRACLTA